MRALWPTLRGRFRFLFLLRRLWERARRWWAPLAKPAPLYQARWWPEEKATGMEEDEYGQVIYLDAGHQHRPSWNQAISRSQGKRLAYSHDQCYNNPEAVRHDRHLLEGIWYLSA